jgi:hypothetical protein
LVALFGGIMVVIAILMIARALQPPNIRIGIGIFTSGGVATGLDPTRDDVYVKRRAALIDTWFPSTSDSRRSLREIEGIDFVFVAVRPHPDSGRVPAPDLLALEKRAPGSVMWLPDADPRLQQGHASLPYMTAAYLDAARQHWDSSGLDFVVKMDDDLYLSPERLSLAAIGWRREAADYIGCMTRGPVWMDPHLRWAEKSTSTNALILGNEYPVHALGQIYALSAYALRNLISREHRRYLTNEDVSVGMWMMGLDVTFKSELRLCRNECTEDYIAVTDHPVKAGLRDPAHQMYDLHADPACRDLGVVVPAEGQERSTS